MTTYLQIPEGGGGVSTVASLADLPAVGSTGDIYLLLDTGRIMWWNSLTSAWENIDTDIWSGSVAATTSITPAVTSGVLTADLKLSNTAASSANLKATTTVKGGTGAAQGLHVEIPEAGAAQTGVIKSTDWSSFDSKQPGDTDLTAIAALAGPGIACKTSTDPAAAAWAQRTVTGTANRIGVTNGDGASGNPTINLDATQFPSSGTADVGLPLVTSASNTATWSLPQATVDMEMSGFISWGGSGNYYSFIRTTGVFTVLRPGIGRIGSSKKTWAGGENVTLTSDKSYFIAISDTNTLEAIDIRTIYSADVKTYFENFENVFKTKILLFSIHYDADLTTPIVLKQNHYYSYQSDIAAHDHFRLGHVFIGAGGLISVLSSANRTIQTSGNAALDDHGLLTAVADGGGAAISTDCLYQNAGGTLSHLDRRSFTISVGTPVAGDVYTESGISFTVLYFAGGVAHAFQSAGTGDPSASGTLTRTSGTGSATLTYTSFAEVRTVPSVYAPAGVPTTLAPTGNTNRWGLLAVYVTADDLQTPSTASPAPIWVVMPSMVAYSGSNSSTAIASLGSASVPDTSQFLQPPEVDVLELVLAGFVLVDGNTRIIPAVTSNGFINGVRSYRNTGSGTGGAGASAVSNAINVSLNTSGFAGALSAADVNVQLAMSSIATYTTRYLDTFDATTDWGTAAGGVYTITTPVATHGKGTSPLVQVYETVGGANLVAAATRVSIAADGAVSLIVSETPDGRHAGKIVIM